VFCLNLRGILMNSNTATTRTILAHTLNSTNNPLIGFIRPIFEIVGAKLVKLDEGNFCPTMKVFITSHYDDFEIKFPDQKLFEITVKENVRYSENLAPELGCKYVAFVNDAKSLKPKDYFEVFTATLPDRNKRIVSLDRRPGVPYVFISDRAFIYGPFKWVIQPGIGYENAISLEFIDTQLPGVKLADSQVYKIKHDIVSNISVMNDTDGSRYLMQELPTLSGSEFYDYASDDEIVRFCAKLAKENNIKIERKPIDSLVMYLKQKPIADAPFIKNRLSLLAEITKVSNEVQDEVAENISVFLGGEYGKTIVADYIDKNTSRYLDKLKEEREVELNSMLKDKRKEIEEASARIKELNDNKVELSVEVETLLEKSKKEVNLDSAYAEADARLQNKQHKLDELKKAVDEKSYLVDGLVDIEKIEQKIKEAKIREYAEWTAQKTLGDRTAYLQNEFIKADDALRERLTKLKPFVDAINGSFVPNDVVHSDLFIKPRDAKTTEATVVRQRAVIAEVQSALASRGRDLKDWQVANLLISTQQSFITFMAGLPGVGKTSLARLIPEVQNIKSRMLEISVARGWTSQKDLIGFFNPLSSRFQPSSTGMHSFLLSLNKEKTQTGVMSYILLDEANLSPIEHYWSSFMGMTDGEGERTLLLGQDRVEIPKSFRFIATINYDGTTEPLSPRLVDRAPILVLEPQSLGSLPTEMGKDVLESSLPISSERMNELFGNSKQIPNLEDSEKSVFDKIKKVLHSLDPALGRPISISPRKEIFLRQYCSKARGIMNSESAFLALDVAVLQHILPLVRGSGKPFLKRLEALKRELDTEGLPLSLNYLARMIAYGETGLHTYDFFCW